MSKIGKYVICNFSFPVCNRTIKFITSIDYKSNTGIIYNIVVYNGYKPRQNGYLHETIFIVDQKKFYRLLNARGKKLGLTFNLERLNND